MKLKTRMALEPKLVLLSRLEEKPMKEQAAMLRYMFTADTRKIYNSLALTPAQKESPAEIVKAIEVFAKGTINETLERHQFNCRQQQEGEKFDDFLTELKFLATNCNFCITCYPGLLRDRIVGGIKSDTVRKLLLAEKNLTYENAVEKCRSFEIADKGMSSISGSGKENLDRVRASSGQFKGGSSGNNSNGYNNNSNNQRDCKFCLQKHKWGKKFCKAAGKNCDVCKKMDHFRGSSVCQGEIVDTNDQTSSISVTDPLQALFLGSVIVSEEEEEGEDGDIVELPDEDVCMLIKDLKDDIGMIDAVEVVELPDEDVSVLTENVHDDTGKIELPDEEVSLLIEDLVSEVVDLLIVDKVTDGIRDLVDQVDQIVNMIKLHHLTSRRNHFWKKQI